MSESKTVTLKIDVPEDLRNAFKGACAVQGKSMKEILIEFMQEYVDQTQGGGAGKK
ncbi:MAG: copy number control protein [Cyanothece sp. SIO1E1]|nr:copy number control protein [Cyanothece sp. SIO1E1]